MSRLSAALSWLLAELRLGLTTFSGPNAARARDARLRAVDIGLAAIAICLPWSTAASLVAIIATFALLLLTEPPWYWVPMIFRPAVWLTLAMFLLALAGMEWTHGVPTHDKVRAIGQVYKLTMTGLLLLHFQESCRARWVLGAFIASNTVLLVYSYVVFAAPWLALVNKPDQPGVPIRNYIDQSHAFALCAVVLAGAAIEIARRGWRRSAIAVAALSLAFFANLAFVNLARTAMIYLPFMVLVLLGRFLSGRRLAIAIATAGVAALVAWAASPNLQSKVTRIFTETAKFGQPIGPEGPASAAMRIEFWEKSLAFARAAPLIGHGTGSTRMLFAQDAQGKTELDALVTANPHNQTLAVALQWGLLGCVVLWAMWASHLWLFRAQHGPAGFAAFVGLVAVVQNVIGSLFNSHLFDFYEGWIYVLAVGIAGGLVIRARRAQKVMRASRDAASALPSS